jgi:hypothetical protein
MLVPSDMTPELTRVYACPYTPTYSEAPMVRGPVGPPGVDSFPIQLCRRTLSVLSVSGEETTKKVAYVEAGLTAISATREHALIEGRDRLPELASLNPE